MKHCSHAECPHRLSTGFAAEYRDEIELCADCRSILSDGPAPRVEEAPPQDDDLPVTIATFMSPHEAHLARAALESHGIEAFVQSNFVQFLIAASWIPLQVVRSNCGFAIAVLERGPFHADDRRDPCADDLRPLRQQRRLALARWFLCFQVVGTAFLAFSSNPLFVVPAGLWLWSRKKPRQAFATAFVVEGILMLGSVVVAGPLGLGPLLPLLATYFAWEATAPNPPEALVATLYPSGPTIEIGEAWDVPLVEPLERSLARRLAVAALVIVALWTGLLVSRSPSVLAVLQATGAARVGVGCGDRS